MWTISVGVRRERDDADGANSAPCDSVKETDRVFVRYRLQQLAIRRECDGADGAPVAASQSLTVFS
jgi:hypothetical protein